MNDIKFNEYLKEMFDIHKKKNHDYSSDDDKFSNFKLCEKLDICSTESGFLVRMTDKVSRVTQLLKKERKVEDESIADTLTDLAIYSLMLREYIETTEDDKNDSTGKDCN